MRGHKVVTMERGTTDEGRQGYAARCETCGTLTFGGAESRTAARRALDGTHEDVVVELEA
ncbi:hypothetical protein [Sanguibacter massiliensis]|uniref:hypothetical protein n=1 Tax=Sanguibacter massiliensis TaxID=1973217 RepID=UPI000C83E9DB|nr:hypothetical protein [Sanguibacter massiliensis]